jgi:hypothetical protein
VRFSFLWWIRMMIPVRKIGRKNTSLDWCLDALSSRPEELTVATGSYQDSGLDFLWRLT